MSTVIVHGIKIFLDNVYSPPPGVFFTSSRADCHTTLGSRVISEIAGGTTEFIAGRKIRVSKGFPSSTAMYTIASKTADTITLDGSAPVATSSETDALIEGQSELRLGERELFNIDAYDNEWPPYYILEGGISPREEGGDISRGGCPAEYSGLEITIENADQFLKDLSDLGISLKGCDCELHEFIGTEDDGDNTSRAIIFTGVCEDITWNETGWKLPIKNNRFKNNVSLSTPITLAENKADIFPLTFGKFTPENPSEKIDNLAKFVRISDIQDETIYTNEYFTTTNPEIKIFPVIAYTTGTTTIRIELYGDAQYSDGRAIDVSDDNV
jgi:hypothetical protein